MKTKIIADGKNILKMAKSRKFPGDIHIPNGAELGGATGAMAPLVFWSQSIKKSRKVSKSLEIKVS